MSEALQRPLHVYVTSCQKNWPSQVYSKQHIMQSTQNIIFNVGKYQNRTHTKKQQAFEKYHIYKVNNFKDEQQLDVYLHYQDTEIKNSAESMYIAQCVNIVNYIPTTTSCQQPSSVSFDKRVLPCIYIHSSRPLLHLYTVHNIIIC